MKRSAAPDGEAVGALDASAERSAPTSAADTAASSGRAADETAPAPVLAGRSACPPLLVIAGPTAVGKTALAVALARQLDGEIVGADARQVYRGLDIGSGKVTTAELQGVTHHLLDIVAPDEPFTMTQYAALAQAAIAAIHARGRLPLLVGGAGLYLRAVVDGLLPPETPPQPALRAALEARWRSEGPAALLRELAARDPVTAARIDARNARRVIRALEVCLITGRPFSAQQHMLPPGYAARWLGLTAERAVLHARADQRIDAMLAGDLIEEVRRLRAAGYDFALPAFSAVGYRELAQYLAGALTLDEARARMRQATHAYQRRQLTWFRAEPRLHWLDATAPDLLEQARNLTPASPPYDV